MRLVSPRTQDVERRAAESTPLVRNLRNSSRLLVQNGSGRCARSWAEKKPARPGTKCPKA